MKKVGDSKQFILYNFHFTTFTLQLSLYNLDFTTFTVQVSQDMTVACGVCTIVGLVLFSQKLFFFWQCKQV